MIKFLNTFIFALCAIVVFAQSPQKFNYQAVARNAQGGVVAGQDIKIRTSILHGSANGTSQYTEIHTAPTSPLGLFNLTIGGGTVQSGNFSNITWGSGDKYLKIEMDITNGNNFVFMGTSQLLSVPYALYAKKAPADSITIIEFSNDANEECSPRVANTWNKRCLNLVVQNNITGFDFNNTEDVITLQKGKYLIRAWGAANYCGGNMLRFHNLSTTDAIYGTPCFSRTDDVDGENSFSILEGVLTVTEVNSKYTLEHYITALPTAAGATEKIFGDFPSFSTPTPPCTWARIVIQKIN